MPARERARQKKGKRPFDGEIEFEKPISFLALSVPIFLLINEWNGSFTDGLSECRMKYRMSYLSILICPITQTAVEFLRLSPEFSYEPMNHSPVIPLYQLLPCTKLGLSQLWTRWVLAVCSRIDW